VNAETIEEQFDYQIPGQDMFVLPDDYTDNLDIVPMSDPNISSNAQRLTLNNTKMQMLQQVPEAKADKTELLKRSFLDLGEKDIDKIFPPEQEAKPQDPVSDIMAASQGLPIKAFPGQDHQSHMQVKSSWLEDPANGGTPIMASVAPVLQANIKEHMILNYQEQLQGAMQAVNPTGAATDQQTMDKVIADAAKMVAENNKAAQLKLQEGTPEAKVAEAELLKAQTDAKELDHQRKKDFADYTIKALEAAIKQMEVEGKLQIDAEKLSTELQKQMKGDGAKMIIEALKGLSKPDKEATKSDDTNTIKAKAGKGD
jgi:hypothetical protein